MVEIRKLNCNVTVVLEKIDYVKSAAFGVWVHAGSRNEDKFNSGVSHFIEHMMFKGTTNRSAKKIAVDMDNIGAQFNAFTGKEATCYYVKSTSENIEKGAEIILDMLNNSLFDAREMTRERKVIKEEMKMTQDQPDELACDEVTDLVFKGTPLGKSIIGTNTSLNNITRNVMVEYRNKEYTKDSIVVSIAGNFDTDRFLDFLEDKFSNFEEKKEPLSEKHLPYQRTLKVITRDIQQSHIALAAKGTKIEDENNTELQLLSSIMGGTMSSRFFQNIREEKGLAYSVYSVSQSYSEDGMFMIYAGVGHDKIKDALNGIKDELSYLKNSSVTTEELNKAKEQAKASYAFSQENITSRMFANGKDMVQLGRVRSMDENLKKINEVSIDSIDNMKNMITDPDKYTVVLVTDKKKDLSKLW